MLAAATILSSAPLAAQTGDRTLTLDDADRITALAHQTKACVLTQASAAIIGAHLKDADIARVRTLRDEVDTMLQSGDVPPSPFKDYEALAPAANYPGRHICVLLPIDAVLKAFVTRTS